MAAQRGGDRSLLIGIRGARTWVSSYWIAVAYPELRDAAAKLLLHEKCGREVLPEELIHDAYLRLAGLDHFVDRDHFVALAVVTMQHVLTDDARKRNAVKRGGKRRRVEMDENIPAPSRCKQVLSFAAALKKLKKLNPRAARVVRLHGLGDKTVAETAKILGISPRSVDIAWRTARGWLFKELENADG
jgi:RNA polymerase sigma factor (TIGR02999 family)